MKRVRSGYIVNAGFFRNTQGQLCQTKPGFYWREPSAIPENLDNNPADVLPSKAYQVIRTPSKL